MPLALLFAFLGAPLAGAELPADLDPQRNLALGKPVVYLPAPNYANTMRGDTDTADLTDGQVSRRADQRIWYEASSVGWSYAGRVNLAVDLGEIAPIGEVAIRFQGGTPQAGISMPLWVEVVVSDGPDEPWFKVAELSRWREGDLEKYEIPRSSGAAWVHRLRFRGLRTRGRLVGLRFYSTAYTVADELYVFKGAHDPQAVRHDPANRTDFTVTGAQLYFHKPKVFVASNVVTPLPIGLIAAASGEAKELTVELTLPEGVRVEGGALGGIDVSRAAVSNPEGGAAYRFTLSTRGGINNKVWGRLWLIGAPASGSQAEIRYRLRWGSQTSPEMRVPLETVEIPRAAVIPQRLTTSLSWWQLEATMGWPEWRKAFSTIGLNALPLFLTWLNPSDAAAVEFTAEARKAGYRIHAIDSTFHQMLSRRGREMEIYCQFEDGSRSSRMCPSYRGTYYREELERVATGVRLMKPSLLHCDIELFGGTTSQEVRKCVRCRQDKDASGIADWAEWQLAKGAEMWSDLVSAVREAVQAAGGPDCEMGLYDGRPHENYQGFWPFSRLYPEKIQTSQVSTYTALEPYQIELIGEEVRLDRRGLPRSDVFPWVTPGDAGTFPGEAFYYSLLECYFNGARGINFWSNRLWDAEYLAAYARAIRVASVVEDIILDGEPFAPEVEGAGRARGMKRGGDIILLVTDYWGDAGGEVRIRVDLGAGVEVIDLDRRSTIARLPSGGQILRVPLEGAAARPLWLRPYE
jgi:hypothetical protein